MADEEDAPSRANQNPKVVFVEIECPPNPKDKKKYRACKTFRLKSNVNNRHVIYAEGGAWLTPRGTKRGYKILSECRIRESMAIVPLSAETEKILRAHEKRRDGNRQIDEFHRETREARKRGDNLPPQPDPKKVTRAPTRVAELPKAATGGEA